MTGEYFEPIPDNKVLSAKCSLDCCEINKTIAEEYKIGYTVKQIIYIEHLQEVLILFERKD